jgi:hypothetical protein
VVQASANCTIQVAFSPAPAAGPSTPPSRQPPRSTSPATPREARTGSRSRASPRSRW